MKRRRWWLALISSLTILLLISAHPAREHENRATAVVDLEMWKHVNKTCLASNCSDDVNYKQLQMITSYMNVNADPCENFHEYACGNWAKANPNASVSMKWTNDQLSEHYVQLFEQWLPEFPMDGRDADIDMEKYSYVVGSGETSTLNAMASKWDYKSDTVLRRMLQYYTLCKASVGDGNGDGDGDGDEGKHSFAAYFTILKQKISWRLRDFNWLETLARLARYGYNKQFLVLEVTRHNASVHHRKIRTPFDAESLELNDQMYAVLKEYTRKSYEDLKDDFDKIETDLQDIKCHHCTVLRRASVNKRLADNAVADDDDNDDDDDDMCDCYDQELMTFDELQRRLPEVDWQQFLSIQIGRIMRSDDSFTVVNFQCIQRQVSYINHLDSETVLLYTIARFLQFLSEQPHNLLKHKANAINCIRQMRKIFYIPMNYIYERAVYAKRRIESEPLILNIFQKLKTEFSARLTSNRMQLSHDILAELQTKLDVMSINVGNLPPHAVLDFYYDNAKKLNFTNNYYYNYMHALEVYYTQHNILPDLVPDSKMQPWNTFNKHAPDFPDSLDSSPYYNCLSNAIVLPFSYLRAPFYDENFWAALVYGDLANSLGHELIHAFDSRFLVYDAYGNPTNLRQRIKMHTKFEENLKCLRNGTQFVEERIADISGSHLALNAFLKWNPDAMKHNGKLYFLQFSQFFCGSAEPDVFRSADTTHDIDNLRLNYTLSSIRKFGEVFNCPLGSAMRPKDICEFW